MTRRIVGESSTISRRRSPSPRAVGGALRRLVDRVDAGERNGTAVVRLSAAAGPDAWVPGVDELELVLASLTRHDTGGGGPGIVDELRQQNFELLTTLGARAARLPASPGLELLFDEPGDLPRLHTDGFKLSQILRNFTVNALKFTGAGHVRISAHAVDDHR